MAKKTQPDDDVDPAELRHALAQLVLTQRARAGDTDCMIWWLTKFGGDEWQPKYPVTDA